MISLMIVMMRLIHTGTAMLEYIANIIHHSMTSYLPPNVLGLIKNPNKLKAINMHPSTNILI